MPRLPSDLDFLSLHRNDLDLSLRILQQICSIVLPDGLEYKPEDATAERTWTDTENPGVKATLYWRLVGEETWQPCSVDIGWGDPLQPAAKEVRMRTVLGPPVRVTLAVQLETLFGWKLHGLFEREAIGLSDKGVPKGYWRPKDLFDLHLMVETKDQNERNLIDFALLPSAVKVAFESRGYPLSRVVRVASSRFGSGPTSQKNWARWRATLTDELAARAEPSVSVKYFMPPESPTESVKAIAVYCIAVLEVLGYAALPGDEVPLAPSWQIERVSSLVEDAKGRLLVRPASAPVPKRTLA